MYINTHICIYIYKNLFVCVCVYAYVCEECINNKEFNISINVLQGVNISINKNEQYKKIKIK